MENNLNEQEPVQQSIPIDASVDLELQDGKFLARMGKDDIFGEMACMNHYPRSATVRAVTDCTVLEMFDDMLFEEMRQSKPFRELIDQKYRDRALNHQLRSVPIFAGLSNEFIGQLREKAKLQRFNPGEAFVKQGEVADSFYIVRLGSVRVSQGHLGGEIGITYLGKGEYFGEIGLLGGGRRTATCTAVDHVEVVRIDAAEFQQMLEVFPATRKEFEELVRARLLANELRLQNLQTTPLDEYLEQGLMQAQNLLILDLESCTRCDACVRACADSHEGVTRLIREGLRYEKYLVPTSCRQCRDPVCIPGCPTGAIHRMNSPDIEIDPIRCIGCGKCANQCPYGNITIHEMKETATSEDAIAPEVMPTRRLGGEALTAEQMREIAIFKDIGVGHLNRNPGAVVRRKFKKGEIICREGEYDYTAFYILEGEVEAYLAFQMTSAEAEKHDEGALSKLWRNLTGKTKRRPVHLAGIAKKEKIAVTCDLCKGLSGPNCVYACPHGAAHRVNPEEFFRVNDTRANPEPGLPTPVTPGPVI